MTSATSRIPRRAIIFSDNARANRTDWNQITGILLGDGDTFTNEHIMML